MGKLRAEPRKRRLLSKSEYETILSVLNNARKAAKDHYVFWDLDEGEKLNAVKKSFLYVADKEGIDLSIRHVRGTNSLVFGFKKVGGSGRMSANESRRRILECLKQAEGPLKKSQIIKETGISASTWNIRIKELLKSGDVQRHGDRRDTTYTLEPAEAKA